MEPVAQIRDGLNQVIQHLNRLRQPEGNWTGELSSSALATATAVTAIQFYLESTGKADVELQQQVEAGLCWLIGEQNSDGGFGDTSLSHSNISTTMLAVAAIHACGKADQLAQEVANAQQYIDSKGGIKGLRARYGNDKTFAVPILAHCAMAGIVPWREVSALPFEAACVPQRFYNLMQLPVVSYAIPALVAIGQVKFANDPPWDPIRKSIRRLSVEPSLRVLERMQPESGGFLEAVPLTSFVAMGLIKSGRHEHPVVESGIRFLRDSFRAVGGCGFQPQFIGAPETDRGDGFQPSQVSANENLNANANATAGSRHYEGANAKGTWPIDTNLATWGTTLTVNAIANNKPFFQQQLSEHKEDWQRCVDWIIGCQTKTKHPFTGAQPGGFGWTDLSGAVPDADDTPGALIALRHFYDNVELWCDEAHIPETKQKLKESARSGVQWLLRLQNRDKGWPTFCKGWGKLPFDRSGSDITAHSIRGLIAWQEEFSDLGISDAKRRGFEYLKRQQLADGSWLPLWFGNQDTEDEINPWYGTSKVLLAYRDADLFDTEPAKIGLEWIVESQNEDGGWGGGESLDWSELHETFRSTPADGRDFSVLGTSSVEETALCAETLLHAVECGSLDGDFRDRIQGHAERGVEWLLNAIELDCISINWPIGFYFAKLWYYEQMYPLVFATSTLTQALSSFKDSQQIDITTRNERDKPGGSRRNICC